MYKLQGPSQIITHDECLDVINEGSVTFVDGKPQKSDITRFQLTCNVQPLSGRDLMLVPEGDRYTEQFYLFTNECEKPLKTNQRVIRCGIEYQIQSVEQWGSYQRARIMKIDVGPNASHPQ